jgi:hypothetical protein
MRDEHTRRVLGERKLILRGNSAQYRAYADECRRLAANMSNAQFKQSLEMMASAWDTVASVREAQLLKQIDRHSGVDSSSK